MELARGQLNSTQLNSLATLQQEVVGQLSGKPGPKESSLVVINMTCTINYGGMGQLSKLPGYRPVTECHRGNVILDLNSN